jgi:hypothetical protein
MAVRNTCVMGTALKLLCDCTVACYKCAGSRSNIKAFEVKFFGIINQTMAKFYIILQASPYI